MRKRQRPADERGGDESDEPALPRDRPPAPAKAPPAKPRPTHQAMLITRRPRLGDDLRLDGRDDRGSGRSTLASSQPASRVTLPPYHGPASRLSSSLRRRW